MFPKFYNNKNTKNLDQIEILKINLHQNLIMQTLKHVRYFTGKDQFSILANLQMRSY